MPLAVYLKMIDMKKHFNFSECNDEQGDVLGGLI